MTTPDAYRDAEYITDVSGIPFETTDGQLDTANRQNERIKKAQSTMKVVFIDRLLRDLDILIYCELSAMYYMDCSVILFAIRAIIQLIFFTPKASPFDPTRNQPFIGAIFASNLFCMVSHNFFTHPDAGEETRGYLHGGLFIDFIGQKAPVSVVRLLALDTLILVLDFVMLGLILERVRTSDGISSSSSSSADAQAREQDESPRQDHDSEERGVLRHHHHQTSDGNEVELDDFGGNEERPRSSIDDQLERTDLLTGPSESPPSTAKDAHFLDTFAAGEAVIMDMGFVDVVRDQWRYNPTTTGRRPSSYMPSNETASFLRERFGLQVRPDGRMERIGG